ncbi:hypothetical protein AB6A40_005489 [Gnathostoma spinigerum]|uniref:Partner of Y14 and mago n=1 Tax=Gnathostoma spinigerum TaxID=75299 RepID=A0ABD6ER92_9BILA
MASRDAFVGDIRIKTKSGDTYIAASQRADGTWRKARRVKDGYMPQEEQPRYESRAMQVARTSTLPVGMSPRDAPKNVPKNAERPKVPVLCVERPNAPITPKDHIQKKINSLNKKLREIASLQEKISSGELASPEKTQLEKIARKEKIEEEIDKLTVEMAVL